MVLSGMRGGFEQRGLLDGMGDIGFDAGGFLKDVGKSAAGSAISAIGKKFTGGGGAKPAAVTGGGYAAPAKKAGFLSTTGGKVAAGAGVLLALGFMFKGRGRR